MSRPLGELLAVEANELLGWATIVVPVPASHSAIRRRGFDHALELASVVAQAAGLPISESLTIAEARDQRALGRKERISNVTGRFTCNSPFDRREYVLLIDDVMTTGATAESATRALLAAGAAEVRVCVLARSW